jgi:hypothetical protein
MKKILFSIIFLLGIFAASAQNKTAASLTYKSAFGVTIWNGGGLTLKTFIREDKHALEFTGFFRSLGARIGGAYEIHGNLNTEGNLKWYVGPALYVGLYNKFDNKAYDGTYIGVGGVVGFDYKFVELPINLSIDWRPAYEAARGNNFFSNYGGLAVRYTF